MTAPAPVHSRGLFVTATDTEVGKTFVAGAIVAALTARGERAAPFKPGGDRHGRARAGPSRRS
ncbi:dethiobiotin synthase [Svornostia abyssi]|uniref:Dethiobiotin synthase n=1 Tax=Svornostia abyssi TaxID=2898438 RepID=A0ABY5PG57_9ACTN|nr:dethiobiotin synthase [Parviterribacteraceae bacterium J379]